MIIKKSVIKLLLCCCLLATGTKAQGFDLAILVAQLAAGANNPLVTLAGSIFLAPWFYRWFVAKPNLSEKNLIKTDATLEQISHKTVSMNESITVDTHEVINKIDQLSGGSETVATELNRTTVKEQQSLDNKVAQNNAQVVEGMEARLDDTCAQVKKPLDDAVTSIQQVVKEGQTQQEVQVKQVHEKLSSLDQKLDGLAQGDQKILDAVLAAKTAKVF